MLETNRKEGREGGRDEGVRKGGRKEGKKEGERGKRKWKVIRVIFVSASELYIAEIGIYNIPILLRELNEICSKF